MTKFKFDKKKPAYGTHQISRPMRTEAPISEENFWGVCMDGPTDVRTYGEGGGHMYKNFTEKLVSS